MLSICKQVLQNQSLDTLLAMDFSALTSAQLTTFVDNCVTHINRILTGAQSGTVGSGRSFQMARLDELQSLMSRASEELRRRGEPGGDFALVEFGEPQ